MIKPPPAVFHPGQPIIDDEGARINCASGGVTCHQGRYYWYGSRMGKGPEGNITQEGVACYSSVDLLSWHYEGLVLPVVHDDSGHPLAFGARMERPKVVYAPGTDQFVMWFHYVESGKAHVQSAWAGVATSTEPAGPFTYVGKLHPNGQDFRDMTVFVDDDGQGYLYYASEGQDALHVVRLADDYTTVTEDWRRLFVGRAMEAPVVFKRNGRYWFIASGSTWFRHNAARHAVAPHPFGPWTELGNPAFGPGRDKTFETQSTAAVQLAGTEDTILISDRWYPQDHAEDIPVWLPVFETDGQLCIRWFDHWDVSVFEELPCLNELAEPPRPPGDIQLDGENAECVWLSWQASPDDHELRGYHVWRDGQIVGTALTTNGYRDDYPATTGTYTYEVSAIDIDGRQSPRSHRFEVIRGESAGFLADIYSGQPFKDRRIRRREPRITYHWDQSSPDDQRLYNNHFSIRWRGLLQAPVAGNYRFMLRASHPALLVLDGKRLLAISNRTDEVTATVELSSDQPVDVMVTYAKEYGPSDICLDWEGPGLARTTFGAPWVRLP